MRTTHLIHDIRDTREEIIDLAEDLIRQNGYNAFSYSDIAAMLEVRPAAIHYHFPSKSDLGVAVIERELRQTHLAEELGMPYYAARHEGGAVAMADGPGAGLALMDVLEASGDLAEYHLLHAARADLLRRLGRRESLRKGTRRGADKAAALENVKSPRALTDEMRRRSKP